MTMAPTCDSDSALPVLQRSDPPTRLSLLSQSMMDQQVCVCVFCVFAIAMVARLSTPLISKASMANFTDTNNVLSPHLSDHYSKPSLRSRRED